MGLKFQASNQEVFEIEAHLERLFATRTLVTAFQPIRDLASVEVVGVEALTRFVCSPSGLRTNGSGKPKPSGGAPIWNSSRWRPLCGPPRIFRSIFT